MHEQHDWIYSAFESLLCITMNEYEALWINIFQARCCHTGPHISISSWQTLDIYRVTRRQSKRFSGGEWSTGAHHSGFHQTSSGDVGRYLRYGTGAQLAMLEHVGTLVLTGTFLGCRERNQFCNRFGDPCHAWWCPVHQLIPCLAVPHFHALWQHHHWYPAGGWGWEVFCGRGAVGNR